MKILTLPLGHIGTNSYLLLPEGSSEAVLIDAPMDAAVEIPRILKEQKRKLAAILLTHCHWDHSWDAAKLAALEKVKIYAGADGKELLERDGFQEDNLYCPPGLEPAKIDAYPKDGDVLEIAGLKIKCFEAPGHCPGSLLFYVKEGKSGALFAGDVIFEGSIGRTDFWGGDFSKLEKSIREKIYTLPEDTAIFPGHGEATSVAREKASNPFVKA